METELYIACCNGDVNKVKELLKHCKKEDIVAKGWGGCTLLHMVCCKNKTIVKELLKHLCINDMIMQDENGNNSIWILCFYNLRLVYLIENREFLQIYKVKEQV